MIQIALRPARLTDYAHILATWKDSLVKARFAKGLDAWEYWSLVNLLLDVWLPELDIKCAVLPEDSDTIVGWCAVYRDRVAFVYTKHRFRKMGVAKQLRHSWPTVPAYGPVSIFERIRASNGYKTKDGLPQASGQGR